MKLLDYIRGNRKGKEAQRLQKKAMQDPFLADAMDGYDSVGGNQERQIEHLRRWVMFKAKAKRTNYAVIWSVAASLLIGIGFSLYFLYQKDHLPEDTFITLEVASKDTVPQQERELAMEKEVRKDSTKPLVSQKQEKKKVVRPAPPVAVMATDIEQAEVTLDESSLMEATTVSVDTSRAGQLAALMKKETEDMKAGCVRIRGRVIDDKGEPLAGATIQVKDTPLGTVADLNGNFTLDADSEKVLIVNYIGYEPVITPIDTGKMLIAMNEEAMALNEVVVSGYGARKQKAVSAAVETDLLETPKPVIGKKAYRKYLNDKLVRPVDEECVQAKGAVVVTFHVDAQGRPIDVTVAKSLCPSADKEAVRLVKEGPDWTKGTKEVRLSIPF